MIIDGFLDKFPVKIEFDATWIEVDRKSVLAVNHPLTKVILGLVYFPWDSLSPLQQEDILKQIERAYDTHSIF